jgi:hypothetical protein
VEPSVPRPASLRFGDPRHPHPVSEWENLGIGSRRIECSGSGSSERLSPDGTSTAMRPCRSTLGIRTSSARSGCSDGSSMGARGPDPASPALGRPNDVHDAFAWCVEGEPNRPRPGGHRIPSPSTRVLTVTASSCRALFVQQIRGWLTGWPASSGDILPRVAPRLAARRSVSPCSNAVSIAAATVSDGFGPAKTLHHGRWYPGAMTSKSSKVSLPWNAWLVTPKRAQSSPGSRDRVFSTLIPIPTPPVSPISRCRTAAWPWR